MKMKFFVDGLQHMLLLTFIAVMGLIVCSCDPSEQQLGIDLLPPGDSISVSVDTLTSFGMVTMIPSHLNTSVSAKAASPDRLWLLGSKTDTLSGTANASFISQLSVFDPRDIGDDPVVDSVVLTFYVRSVEGDTAQNLTFSVHEFTGDLDYDSKYYSDYDIAGAFNPTPLIRHTFKPEANNLYNFPITDADFIAKIKSAIGDTLFTSDSLFKTAFKGLYFTPDQITDGNSFMKIQLGGNYSRFAFRYLPDSINIADATDSDYRWYYLGFSQTITQSVNMFSRDRSGTTVQEILDNPMESNQISYLEGMAGLNVRISLPDTLKTLLQDGAVAVNRSILYLPMVPDSISGIPYEKYPTYLMLANIQEDGTTLPEYDYLTNSGSTSFGKLSRTFDVSTFMDPDYYFSFNIARHLQAIQSGEIAFEESDLLLYINDPISTSKIIKLWSNYADPINSPRIELIYSRF